MAKEKRTSKFIKEFKEFALQGNMFDLAVGVIIGGAFKGLVDALTNNIIMPVISMFTGGLNFSEWKLKLPHFIGAAPVDEAGNVIPNYLQFGDFVSAIINFVIMALVIFLMVKAINSLRNLGKKEAEEEAAAPAAAPAPSTEEVLLGEIRDLLKEKKDK